MASTGSLAKRSASQRRIAKGPNLTNSLVTQRLNRLALPDEFKDRVQVCVEGRLVVLRGVVPSEFARQLVERLLALEPGVDEIRNELDVIPLCERDVIQAVFLD